MNIRSAAIIAAAARQHRFWRRDGRGSPRRPPARCPSSPPPPFLCGKEHSSSPNPARPRHVFQQSIYGCAGGPPVEAATISLNETAAFIGAFAAGGPPPFPERLGFPNIKYQMRFPGQETVDAIKKVVYDW